MASRRRVILLIETNSAYGRGLLSGISRFARVNGAWTFCYDPGQTASEVGFSELRACRADGVIVRAENSQMAAAVARLRLPTVELRGAVDVSNAVSVLPDTKPLVEMALEHLLSRRLPNFAFCGYPGVEFSDQRQQAFIRFVESRKINYHLFPPGAGAPATNHSGFFKRDSPDWMRRLAWIASLPRPIGILAANDVRGCRVLEACETVGLKVPFEAAVVGVDNDEVYCSLSNPALSSVSPNVEAIGFEAATLLDRWMAGQRPVDKFITVPPSHVVVRGSSDATPMHDPALVDAVQLIRSRVEQGINVKQLLSEVEISRSTLERLFRQHMGCTPYEYVTRCRIDRVKSLLLHTDYPLSRVARMSGFRREGHMGAMFRSRTGVTPTSFRESRGYAVPKG